MEVYNRLPEHLQWHCEKMYFTHRVLPDIRPRGTRALFKELGGPCSLTVSTSETVYYIRVEDDGKIVMLEYSEDATALLLLFEHRESVVEYIKGTITIITKGFTRVF
jgi:hypothetical protein